MAYILWTGKQNQVQHYMCVDRSPCYSGLACKESQSIEKNWADSSEGSSKEKQTEALSLSLRVWILLKTLKLPEKDDSKLLYGGVEMGFCQRAEERAVWGSLRHRGMAAALGSSAKANTEHSSQSTISPWSNTGSMCVCVYLYLYLYIHKHYKAVGDGHAAVTRE